MRMARESCFSGELLNTRRLQTVILMGHLNWTFTYHAIPVPRPRNWNDLSAVVCEIVGGCLVRTQQNSGNMLIRIYSGGRVE